MNLLFEKKILIVILLLLKGSIIAFSQSKTDSVRWLPEIVVTQDTRHNQARSSSPIQMLDSEKLASLGSLQLSDAAKHFAGVSVKDYGGIGGLKTISVRGFGANHTAVAYDGIPVSDVQTGQTDLSRFSSENVDNISLNIGQTDDIFQPARIFASASVLNIRSKKANFKPGQSISAKAGLKSGSFGLFNPSFLINSKISRTISTSFTGEWLSANGKYPYILHYGNANKDSSSVEIRKNSDVRNLRLEGTLFAGFPEKSSGYLKTYYYNSLRGLPGAIIFYNDKSFASQRLSDHTFFTQAHFEHQFSDRWAIQLNARYNKSGSHFVDSAWLSQLQKLDITFAQNELYGSLSALYRFNEHLSFAASSDLSFNSMEANLYHFASPARLTSLSSIAGKYVTERLTAIGSLLATKTAESVKSGSPGAGQQKLSPFVSISVKPFETAGFRIRAFYKNIYRLPTFNDLYYLRTGERNLLPEDANQVNLGLTYSTTDYSVFKNILLSADAYHNRIKNKIVAKPSASLFEWTMLNFGTVYINGFDLNMETLIKLHQDIMLEIGGNYTFQRATDKTDKNGRTYGHQLPYTPFHSGSGRANLISPWLNAGYSVLWSGTRYSGYQNYAENRMRPYSDHSISFSRSFIFSHTSTRAELQLLNVFNKNYEVVSGFPMPGRSFRVNVFINY